MQIDESGRGIDDAGRADDEHEIGRSDDADRARDRLIGQRLAEPHDVRPQQRAAFAMRRQIGERLFLSPLTVKTHVNRAMAKLGARDRAQLVVIAYQSGLVRAGDPGP